MRPSPFRCTLIALVAITLAWSFLTASEDDKQPPAEATKVVTGTITLFQKESKQFVLKTDAGKELILTIDPRTTLRSAGKNMLWFDLKEGMTASIIYAPVGPQPQLVALSVQATKDTSPAASPEEDKAAAREVVVPLSVKGRIENVKPDLSEMTIKTPEDKEVVLVIDEDLRGRLKRNETSLTNLNQGSEVFAVYAGQEGKNTLLLIRDMTAAEKGSNPALSTLPVPAQSGRPPALPAIPKVETSQPNVAQQNPSVAPLPVISVPLPTGFVAKTNKPLGALEGDLVQVKTDMAILALGAKAQPVEAQPPGTQQSQPPAANPSAKANPLPHGNRDYYAILPVTSKEPFVMNQQTRIVMNGKLVRLTELMEGTQLRLTFTAQEDGSRRVQLIDVGAALAGNQKITGLPEKRDEKVTRAGYTPQGSVLTGLLVRRKNETLFLQTGQNEIAFVMMAGSLEPLQIDEATRFQVNNKEGRFSDLQAGMKAQVFLEMLQNVRRVCGIVASANDSAPAGNGQSKPGRP